jgi:hypothetical protein
MIIFFVLFIGGFALADAKIEAELIKNRGGYQIVDVKRSKLELHSDGDNPVMYLGHLSEYFVLYEAASKSVVFVKPMENAPIIFQTNPKRS